MSKTSYFQGILPKSFGQLIEIRRRHKGVKNICGFVVDFTPAIVLFQQLDMDTFRLNGYVAILAADVKAFRVFDRPAYWRYRAVKQLKLKPEPLPSVSISSLSSLLSSVAARFPLLTVYREKIDAEICYIGRLSKLSRATFTLEDLNCNAEWTGPRRIKYADVTSVHFGWGYESALAAVAPRSNKV